jgi:carboxy-terminal domain RNA polymerase II polypeptide A small phosphatase
MKKLLVLDLDETLIHASETPLARAPDFKVFGYSVYRRPYLSEFLAFCHAHFAVAVWSSASDDYVQAIVRQIFAQPERLVAVWGASKTTIRRSHPGDCDRFGQPLPEYHDQKRLQKLTRFSWSLDNMLMVDDSHEKCSVNFGNAIYPAPFYGDATDDELCYLAGYLHSIKHSDRVRRLEKRGWRASAVPMQW